PYIHSLSLHDSLPISSHADWLNDLSSIPPVSVTIAIEKSSVDSPLFPFASLLPSLLLLLFEPPHAAKNMLKTKINPNDNKNFLLDRKSTRLNSSHVSI